MDPDACPDLFSWSARFNRIMSISVNVD